MKLKEEEKRKGDCGPPTRRRTFRFFSFFLSELFLIKLKLSIFENFVENNIIFAIDQHAVCPNIARRELSDSQMVPFWQVLPFWIEIRHAEHVNRCG